MRKKERCLDDSWDKTSFFINDLILKIPYIGKSVSRLYLWKFMMFNFMLVGSSGMVISWILYEGFFRNILVSLWGGTFLAMFITTILVFMWNYVFNKKWSLGINSQIYIMKKHDLNILRGKVDSLLDQKFDRKGRRIS